MGRSLNPFKDVGNALSGKKVVVEPTQPKKKEVKLPKALPYRDAAAAGTRQAPRRQGGASRKGL